MENVPSVSIFSIVEVKIMEVLSSGLHVKILETGEKGFIPKREITWERRVDIPVEIPELGTKIKAAILDRKKKTGLVLSLRNVTDPWHEKIVRQKKYRKGGIVLGDVVNVRYFGAYVQLEPGIDGVVYPEEASFVRGQNIEDILWVGDKVEAEITNLDYDKRIIELSITKVQQRKSLPKTVAEQASELLEQFGKEVHLNVDEEKKDIAIKPLARNKLSSLQRIHKLSRILIVDDEPDWQNRIKTALEKTFRIDVHVAANGNEVFGKFQQGTPYDLVLMDVALGKDSGVELAQVIRDANPYLPILLISTAPLQSVQNQYASHVLLEEFSFSQKDSEVTSIQQKISEMSSGHKQTAQLSAAIEKSWLQQLGAIAFSEKAVPEIFAEILEWLHGKTAAEQCFLIKLDKSLRYISIVTSYPLLPKEVISIAQDGLYYSPARQVLEANSVLIENSIDLSQSKYNNFFQNIPFSSFLGLPIQNPNQSTAKYGIILLDETPSAFSGKDNSNNNKIIYVQMAANLLAVAIERTSLFGYVQRFESQYSLGQLAGDLLHELGNKLNALDTRVNALEALWDQKSDISSAQGFQRWFEKTDKHVKGLLTVKQEIRELSDAYAQKTQLNIQAFDINTVVLNVLRQLSRTAKQAGVNLYAKQDKSLPEIFGYSMSLKQVVLNLVLNAIQIYELQHNLLKETGKQSPRQIHLQDGMVVVQTKYVVTDQDYPIEIRVIDNGPGIHWRNWDRVFRPGFSGRGGAGLGLYISRNQIERIGGKLMLLDSILFTGTVFVIKLPVSALEDEDG